MDKDPSTVSHAVIPDFLDLPARSVKPRLVGLTHVDDQGLTPHQSEDLLTTFGSSIDIWKWAWGTSYRDEHVGAKLELLKRYDVRGCLSGTLLEIAWAQGRIKECLAWAETQGFAMVEISRGLVGMTLAEKTDLVNTAAKSFQVIAGVGSQDPDVVVDIDQWCLEVCADLAAGAERVITEVGTGLYRRDGTIRADLADALVEVAGLPQVIFDARYRAHQVWFIRHFGADVNLANVRTEEIVGLEALRLGLRTETSQLLNP
jgi:phosphosulfolactate synthase